MGEWGCGGGVELFNMSCTVARRDGRRWQGSSVAGGAVARGDGQRWQEGYSCASFLAYYQ